MHTDSIDRPVVGRFAPSPTGRMHAGNLYSSLVAWLIAKSSGGSIVLRIEDLDRDRSKPEFIDQVQRDYETFGLTWDNGPYFQNNRDEAYEAAFNKLAESCGTYPCFCSRADLKAASAPHLGEKNVYARTCRYLTKEEQDEKRLTKDPSTRVCVPSKEFAFQDLVQGAFSQNLETECGDFLIRRADGMFAYQLAVVVDDGEQGITSVTRGYDLITSTPQQLFLQEMLGYQHPIYAHVPLIVNEQGKRLSKRDKSASLDQMIEQYGSPEGVLGHLAFVGLLTDADESISAEELLSEFSLSTYQQRVQNEVGSLLPITWK